MTYEDRVNGYEFDDVVLAQIESGEREPDGRVPVDFTPAQPSPLAGVEPASFADAAVAFGVGLLGLCGFLLSFVTVKDSPVGDSFGRLDFLLPVIVDIGIGVFTALDLRMAARRMRTQWVRLFPWALNAVTVYLNAVDQPTLAGKIAHAAPPVLWIAAVEAAAVSIKRRVEGPKVVPDKIPLARWVLAPIPTLLLWRRMRMWGVTSYAEALDRERNRKLVKARLFQRYDKMRKVPPETRVLYRMGELVASDVVVEVHAEVPATPAPVLEPEPSPEPVAATARVEASSAPALAPAPAPERSAEASQAPAPATTGDIEKDAREVVKERFGGKTPGRTSLLGVLKAEPYNHTISNADGADLVRRLKAEEATRAQS